MSISAPELTDLNIDPGTLGVTGDLEITENGSLTVRTEMEPLGELTISTHGQGESVPTAPSAGVCVLKPDESRKARFDLWDARHDGDETGQ